MNENKNSPKWAIILCVFFLFVIAVIISVGFAERKTSDIVTNTTAKEKIKKTAKETQQLEELQMEVWTLEDEKFNENLHIRRDRENLSKVINDWMERRDKEADKRVEDAAFGCENNYRQTQNELQIFQNFFYEHILQEGAIIKNHEWICSSQPTNHFFDEDLLCVDMGK